MPRDYYFYMSLCQFWIGVSMLVDGFSKWASIGLGIAWLCLAVLALAAARR